MGLMLEKSHEHTKNWEKNLDEGESSSIANLIENLPSIKNMESSFDMARMTLLSLRVPC